MFKNKLGLSIYFFVICLFLSFQNCSKKNMTLDADEYISADAEDMNSAMEARTLANTKPNLAEDICIRDGEPIAESFRLMLGRNPKLEESKLYSEMMLDGIQVAFFEPYVSVESEARTIPQDSKCFSWGGKVTNPENGGVAFNSLKFAGSALSTKEEWIQKGGNFSQFLSLQFRTFVCRLPTHSEYTSFVNQYRSNINLLKIPADEVLKSISSQIKALAPSKNKICYSALNDITARIWGTAGTPLQFAYCNLNEERAPRDHNSKCYFVWKMLYETSLSVTNDLIHDARSTVIGVSRNEPAGCYSSYDPVVLASTDPSIKDNTIFNPHAIGEYIAQLYRLLLGRMATDSEIETEIIRLKYAGGDTQTPLRNFALKLQERDEYKKSAKHCLFVIKKKQTFKAYLDVNVNPALTRTNLSREEAMGKCETLIAKNTSKNFKCLWGNIVLNERADGVCSTQKYQCDQGLVSSPSIATQSWICLGVGGGANTRCP